MQATRALVADERRHQAVRFGEKRNSIWRKGKEKKKRKEKENTFVCCVGCGVAAVLFTFAYIKTRRCDFASMRFPLLLFGHFLSPYFAFPAAGGMVR